ncbi:MAG: TonB-dependent hemoglobin/transferrin/lactoferrin family receptor [Gammaproteobacteria bacterium]|nr:TonB-dependent hemoglobin/transferrin/lactoferrin family receptor [Gammaproteobacteria bacterium]
MQAAIPHTAPFPIQRLVLGIVCCVLANATHAADSERNIEEVIVTATLLPRSLEDIAGTVSVISAADIERQLADDLNDITRFQPGLSMDTASRGGNQGFVIRGIGGNRVLTVIDGIRSSDIYAAGPASYGKDAFEVDDLRAVEIIRGPASVLYGADAMGGAVILRSKDPRDYLDEGESSAFSLRSSANSVNDHYKAGLSYVFQQGNFGSVVQYTRRQFGESEINGPGKLNPQDGKFDNWMVKGVWTPNAAHQLRLTVDSSDELIDTRMDSELTASVKRSEGSDETNRLRSSLAHTWTLDVAFADTMETQLHWQRTDAEQYSEQLLTSYAFVNRANPASFSGTPAERFSDFEFNQETSNAGILLSKTLDTGSAQHAMIYGFKVDRTETERPRHRCDTQISTGAVSCNIPSYPMAPPEVFPNKTFPDTTTTRAGLYWQDEVTLGASGFTVIPGVRYEHYEMNPHKDALLNGGGDISNFGGFDVVDVEEEQVSLNLGVIYDLNDTTSFFAQYAEGYRPPNFDESNQAFVNLGHGYATVPNPDLEPEFSRGIEAGIRANFARTSLSLAVYDNAYDNFIESQTIGTVNGISLFQDTNIGEARIYGTEATGLWRATDNWQLRTSIAWSRGKDENANRPLNSVDPLTGVFSARYDDSSGRWGVETLLTLVDEQDRVSAPDRVTGESYSLVDLIGSYQLTEGASVRVGIFNLFDEKYARWGSIKGLAATDANNIAKAQAPGTNFRVGVNYEF